MLLANVRRLFLPVLGFPTPMSLSSAMCRKTPMDGLIASYRGPWSVEACKTGYFQQNDPFCRILGKSPTLFMRVSEAVAFGFVISPRLGHEYVKGASGAFLSSVEERVAQLSISVNS
jgi:hypothetical protein